ncbi:unnamed protein product [Urochloa humidicola]
MYNFLKDFDNLGVKITYSQESERAPRLTSLLLPGTVVS